MSNRYFEFYKSGNAVEEAIDSYGLSVLVLENKFLVCRIKDTHYSEEISRSGFLSTDVYKAVIEQDLAWAVFSWIQKYGD